MAEVEVIATEELGDRSYVAHDGRRAVVVDPQRDIDRVVRLLDERGLGVAVVCETHRHNDYVTGGFALAQAFGAQYVVPADEDITAEHVPVHDGDTLAAGELRVRAIATPGHTHGHAAYAVDEGDDSDVSAVFTGGSLLYGSVGRTDLAGTADTDVLTRSQYRSVRRLASLLPGDTPVYPTHGFGSFCSAASATVGRPTTLAEEQAGNDAFVISDEDAFVERLLAGLTDYPAYYAHVGPINKRGPSAPDLSPAETATGEQVRKRIAGGEWVVDLRSRRAFAAGHVSGMLGIELAASFATYLGWLIPWGTPLTLIGESPQQIADAQRQLVRIGIDRPAGATTHSPTELADGQPLEAYPVVTFTDLAAARARNERPHVLDVRRRDEWRQEHVRGALNVPLHDLADRIDDLPTAPLWVHCAGGYRASIGASMLARAGRDVVLIDDDYSAVESAGLEVTPE